MLVYLACSLVRVTGKYRAVEYKSLGLGNLAHSKPDNLYTGCTQVGYNPIGWTDCTTSIQPLSNLYPTPKVGQDPAQPLLSNPRPTLCVQPLPNPLSNPRPTLCPTLCPTSHLNGWLARCRGARCRGAHVRGAGWCGAVRSFMCGGV